MTKLYNVHLYREMKLFFPNIEAESQQEAANKVADMISEQSESYEDCEGVTLGALVDVQGNSDFSESMMIDFQAGRSLKVAEEMLAALQDAEREIEEMLQDLCDEPEEDASAHRTLATIRAVIAKARGET